MALLLYKDMGVVLLDGLLVARGERGVDWSGLIHGSGETAAEAQ